MCDIPQPAKTPSEIDAKKDHWMEMQTHERGAEAPKTVVREEGSIGCREGDAGRETLGSSEKKTPT